MSLTPLFSGCNCRNFELNVAKKKKKHPCFSLLRFQHPRVAGWPEKSLRAVHHQIPTNAAARYFRQAKKHAAVFEESWTRRLLNL